MTGKPAKLSQKLDTAKGPVFFCCDQCPKKYEADPAKYEKKVEKQQEVLMHYPKVQEKCPLTGKPIDAKVTSDKGGQKVAFCCTKCRAKYEADPDKYKEKVAASFTYKEMAKCPITGKPVDVSIKLDTDKGPVYFCCKGCPKEYKANEAKYEDKVDEQRQAMAHMDHVQVTCPLSGKPVSDKAVSDQNGEKVHFCCDKCKESYEKDPAKYNAKLEESVTYQTKCPVMGEPIDAKSYVELADGRKIYLCCNKCAAKLTENPEKYEAKLREQHINVKPEELKEAKPAS